MSDAPKDYMHEDELPTMDDYEYGGWYAKSWIQDGVRVGPVVQRAKNKADKSAVTHPIHGAHSVPTETAAQQVSTAVRLAAAPSQEGVGQGEFAVAAATADTDDWPEVRVQACRPEDRAMLATAAGKELLAAAVESMRNDTRTDAQKIADGVAFIMGPNADEGTRAKTTAPARDGATPRTDAAILTLTAPSFYVAQTANFVHESLARTLENELNAALRENAELLQYRVDLVFQVSKTKAATVRAEEAESELAAERAIVDRIWDIYGRPSYDELNGRSIYDLINADREELAALRKRLEDAGSDLPTPFTYWIDIENGALRAKINPNGSWVAKKTCDHIIESATALIAAKSARIESLEADCAAMKSSVARYQEKADAIHRYLTDKKDRALMAVITELSLDAAARASQPSDKGAAGGGG